LGLSFKSKLGVATRQTSLDVAAQDISMKEPTATTTLATAAFSLARRREELIVFHFSLIMVGSGHDTIIS